MKKIVGKTVKKNKNNHMERKEGSKWKKKTNRI